MTQTQDQVDDRRNVTYFALMLIAVAAGLLGIAAISLGGLWLFLLIPAMGMAVLVGGRVRFYWKLHLWESSTLVRK